MKIIHFITILRPANAVMAGGAVWLGAWISDSRSPALHLSILACVAFISTGFGNVINDILDRETDRISHPERPLAKGEMHGTSAVVYAVLLATAALVLACTVAPIFGFATGIPLAMLVAYAILLKGTPFAGNLLVSFLVAYSLLFGSLGAPHFTHLIVPAALAMLLNLSREIIKDVQDSAGDRAAGIVTTAVLPALLLRRFIYLCSGLYMLLVYLPYFKGNFGIAYVAAVTTTALPLHGYRISLLMKNDWTSRCSRLSLLLKIEMLAGLAALAVDRISSGILR